MSEKIYCSNCGSEIKEKDNFCKKCGQEQFFDREDDASLEKDTFKEIDIIKNEEEIFIEDNTLEIESPNKKSFAKSIFKGAGIGGLAIGGGFLYVVFYLLYFLFVASTGLSMIWLAISLFSQGSIILGLVTLFIGTPLAIGLSFYFFWFFLVLSIFALIVWGGLYIFGFDVSFDNVWDGIWFAIKILILGSMTFFGGLLFIDSVKNNKILSFFKENWFFIIIFFFLLWSLF